MNRKIVVFCPARPSGRHRWRYVEGVMSTPENPYWERRCLRCKVYESEVR